MKVSYTKFPLIIYLIVFSVRSDIREYLPNSRVVAASLSMDGVPITSLGEYRVQTLFFPRTVNKVNQIVLTSFKFLYSNFFKYIFCV
jgi:hypothetical protein